MIQLEREGHRKPWYSSLGHPTDASFFYAFASIPRGMTNAPVRRLHEGRIPELFFGN